MSSRSRKLPETRDRVTDGLGAQSVELGIMRQEGSFMLFQIIGAVVGGAIGFAAYKFIGCSSGACPITSNPYVSILVGALVGFMIPGGLTA